MDLYLDSVDFKEIERAFELGFLKGLTTTPTFMHRHGITDIDAAIVKLSGMVPELQVEALGDSVETILAEADRIMALPLESEPVFKVPISNAGVMACQRLTAQGRRVNVHLIYTLNQAYMAVASGAAFVCPLAGRLQDQGHDAVKLFEQCVEMIDKHGYDSKVMFSSVRHPEHVRQALLAGVHVCTVPYGVIMHLCDNSLTALGTAQFFEHTQLMTTHVKELIRPQNPVCKLSDTLSSAMVKMTESRLGVVTLVDDNGKLAGIFTDGDLRRRLQEDGREILDAAFDKIAVSESPVTIGQDALLDEAVKLFKEFEVDSIIVLDGEQPTGVLDIQDLVKLGLLGQEHL
ncbi:MAG: CBS domain-containing protein [Gammaproteobacteria bacterium]|jgi:transaldolase|nr:CBS domain-containing protein [Gammaproteobacteria bacterium]